ncbi:hypothetical protein HK414_07245 [Ramlibacter terrae]|uniref:Response regulatory domain-containing protein n=1 Tax=Ramlibacter terrae TaxID=2732511 RepID=A0ABX6P2P2_9BURK|nr:hypothetical protein HK414_07245 [Ramlibacter terrae]
MTAAASAEDRARCAEAGMDDYLTKPLQVAALAQALEKWIRRGSETAQQEAAAAPVATEPAPGETPVMDFGRLEEFREFDDEELSMTREVIALFVADTPVRLAAIEAAIAAGDAQALASAAHALKGAAATSARWRCTKRAANWNTGARSDARGCGAAQRSPACAVAAHACHAHVVGAGGVATSRPAGRLK